MRSGSHNVAVHEKASSMLDFLGMIITEVDHASAIRCGMGMAEGLVIMVVGWGGAADRAGVEAGDIITAVDGKPTATLKGVEDCLSAHQPRTPITFMLRRAGALRLVTVSFEEGFAGGVHRIDSSSSRISRIRSL